MSDVERLGDVPARADGFSSVMAEVRRRLEAGEIPEPVEGEVVERCPICDAPATYTMTVVGGWRIRPPVHNMAIHEGKASANAELELEPPTRSKGYFDEDDDARD